MRETAPPPAPPRALTREQRLAAKLRENLQRRKAQAREIEGAQPLPNDNPDR